MLDFNDNFIFHCIRSIQNSLLNSFYRYMRVFLGNIMDGCSGSYPFQYQLYTDSGIFNARFSAQNSNVRNDKWVFHNSTL